MVLDFGALPPEINSARMYFGPGSGPMLAAAAAWDSLAAELGSAVASYSSAISGLVDGPWRGPASTAMASAAAPYAGWLGTTAAQAKQAGAQAKAAAAAYHAAFAMTVPPPVVAANRVQLASLVATNVLGQNTPAIAATEAHYSEMWAQDAAAMYGYAGASAAATKLTPFGAPGQTTNPGGVAGQTAAVAQAAGTSAGSNAQTALSQFTATVPSALQSLTSPVQSASPGSVLSVIEQPPALPLGLQPGDVSNAMTNLASSSFSPMGLAGITQAGADIAVLRAAGIAPHDPFGLGGIGLGGLGLGGLDGLGLVPAIGMGAGPAGSASLVSAVSASMGHASLVGAVSTPPSWAAAAPGATPVAAPLPGTTPSAAPQDGMPGVPGMPMGATGRGMNGGGPRYGFRITVMGRPSIAG